MSNAFVPWNSLVIQLSLEHFTWLAECYRFDGSGLVTHSPSVEDVRQHVEARWRESRGG